MCQIGSTAINQVPKSLEFQQKIALARDLYGDIFTMQTTARQQLEQRLLQLDDAIQTLRRGFARLGKRPPDVCELMQEERNAIVQLLSVEQALDGKLRSVSWDMGYLPSEGQVPAKLAPPTLWQRIAGAIANLFGGSPANT